jgi:hypothetical protein
MSDLLVLVQGTFGDAVATALARDHAVRVAPLATDPLDALLDGVDFVAVASWRRDLAA